MVQGLGHIVPLKQIEYGLYGVHGDLVIIYPKLYSIYLRGTICIKLAHVVQAWDSGFPAQLLSRREGLEA